jgi:hypothetical protein
LLSGRYINTSRRQEEVPNLTTWKGGYSWIKF